MSMSWEEMEKAIKSLRAELKVVRREKAELEEAFTALHEQHEGLFIFCIAAEPILKHVTRPRTAKSENEASPLEQAMHLGKKVRSYPETVRLEDLPYSISSKLDSRTQYYDPELVASIARQREHAPRVRQNAADYRKAEEAKAAKEREKEAMKSLGIRPAGGPSK